ncbi:MAG: family 43 glycosylhydrolase [Fibrobacteria bacterium]
MKARIGVVLKNPIKSFLCFLCAVSGIHSQSLNPTGGGGMHDPVMIKEGNTYFIYATTGAYTSTDKVKWSRASGFVPSASWQSQQVPGHAGYWAPDISYRDGKYWLYYSMSTFGSQHSAIGLATKTTLIGGGTFEDQGLAVKSPSSDGNYNAIDPNAIEDGNGNVYLNWGSWWDGIFIRQLDPKTGKFLDTASTTNIATRVRTNMGIEGAFIIRTRGYFYLFVSWDKCCAGLKSTYNMRIGRSKNVTGPYMDMSGVAMLKGGGTLLADGSQFAGGHNGIFEEDGQFYVVYHVYKQQGSDLEIRYLYFDKDNWPTFDRSMSADLNQAAARSVKKESLLPSSFRYPMSFTTDGDYRLSLFDFQGKSLLRKQVSSNKPVQFPGIKPGSYYLQLNSKERTYKQRIIVY